MSVRVITRIAAMAMILLGVVVGLWAQSPPPPAPAGAQMPPPPAEAMPTEGQLPPAPDGQAPPAMEEGMAPSVEENGAPTSEDPASAGAPANRRLRAQPHPVPESPPGEPPQSPPAPAAAAAGAVAPAPAAAPAPAPAAAAGAAGTAGTQTSQPPTTTPANNAAPPAIPLPSVGDAFTYSPEGLRDPFFPEGMSDARSTVLKSTGEVDYDPHDPLQSYELKQYHLVGVLWNVPEPKAMVSTPDGKVWTIRQKVRLGREGAVVAAIRESEIVLVKANADGTFKNAVPIVMAMKK
ncbi:MAG: hypothetical protein C5B49_11190 [Bdellovibrio sp.]|nr:MAG: hypothetical protein C5B49_11190 [Bdellovibrio sp.]